MQAFLQTGQIAAGEEMYLTLSLGQITQPQHLEFQLMTAEKTSLVPLPKFGAMGAYYLKHPL